MVFLPLARSAYGGNRAVSPAGGGSLPAKDLPDKDWQAGWQAGAYGGKTVVRLSQEQLLQDIMARKHYTYVLRSERDGCMYVGLTSDLRKRIEAHNKGKVRSTKSRRPLNLVYHEEYQDKTSARKREIFLKSGQGRLFLKAKLELQELANDRIGPQVA